MQKQQERADVGVIVGRFQIHDLHDGHRDLIEHARENHGKVIILLGLSPLMNTTRNPLDFHSRKAMILDAFPDVTVLYVKDCADDRVWSKKVDEVISDATSPTQTVMLYGSRDSFIPHYHGRYDTDVLEPSHYISATEERRKLRIQINPNADSRAGMVYAAMNRFPVSYTTVDVAVFNDDNSKLLLGRKKDEDKYRLIGGFVDPTDASLEAACRREVEEEAHIAITDPVYVSSYRVDDWRYRGEVDKILTSVFRARIFSGRPAPGDDLHELRWFDISDIPPSTVVNEHVPLLMMIGLPGWVQTPTGIQWTNMTDTTPN